MDNSPEDLLREARTVIRDLIAGYPVNELHTNPTKLIERITDVLADDGGEGEVHFAPEDE